jgi:hypothetical protein
MLGSACSVVKLNAVAPRTEISWGAQTGALERFDSGTGRLPLAPHPEWPRADGCSLASRKYAVESWAHLCCHRRVNTPSRFVSSTRLALLLALLTSSVTWAGTFKHITIDGSFADWAGVPVAATDDEGDMVEGTLKGFDLREVYVANDEQYLYLRVVIYPSSTNPDYSKYHHHFYFDTDNDPGTGHGALGLGSEMMIEDAGGYSERYGTFNDGQVTGLDWAQAPSSMLPTYQYEARVSRVVRDTQPADVPVGSGNPERDLLVFSQDEISIGFEVQDSNWAIEDQGSAFPYVMSSAPTPFIAELRPSSASPPPLGG